MRRSTLRPMSRSSIRVLWCSTHQKNQTVRHQPCGLLGVPSSGRINADSRNCGWLLPSPTCGVRNEIFAKPFTKRVVESLFGSARKSSSIRNVIGSAPIQHRNGRSHRKHGMVVSECSRSCRSSFTSALQADAYSWPPCLIARHRRLFLIFKFGMIVS